MAAFQKAQFQMPPQEVPRLPYLDPGSALIYFSIE